MIEPEAAKQYEASHAAPLGTSDGSTPGAETGSTPAGSGDTAPGGAGVGATGGAAVQTRPHAFHGTVDVPPATAKMRLVEVADEIVSVLVSDPNALVKVTVEISAEFPSGAKDTVKRAVSENARSLGLKSADWE